MTVLAAAVGASARLTPFTHVAPPFAAAEEAAEMAAGAMAALDHAGAALALRQGDPGITPAAAALEGRRLGATRGRRQ